MAEPKPQLLEVWKTPSRGCCGDWFKHLEVNAFPVRVHESGNTQIRTSLGVPIKHGSCRTALIGGCDIGGHLPAPEMHRLRIMRSQAIGLAVPGMLTC